MKDIADEMLGSPNGAHILYVTAPACNNPFWCPRYSQKIGIMLHLHELQTWLWMNGVQEVNSLHLASNARDLTNLAMNFSVFYPQVQDLHVLLRATMMRRSIQARFALFYSSHCSEQDVPMANLFWEPFQGEPNHTCGLAGDDTNQRQNVEWIQAYDKES